MEYAVLDMGLTAYHWTSTVAYPMAQGLANEYPLVLPTYVAVGMVAKLWMLYAYCQRPAVKKKLESWGVSIP